MIATLTEIKTLLGISVSTYDTIIQANMPIVENFICRYCKNDFVDYTNRIPSTPLVMVQDDSLQLVNSTNSVNSSTVDFTTYRLVVGDNVRFYGTTHNEKVFTISSITTNSIVFNSVNTVTNENYGDTIMFVKIKYPEELKRTYAFMINYNINKDTLKGLKSETILGYSYTLSDANNTSYPDSAIQDLYNYRCLIKRPLLNANTSGVSIYGY